MTGFPRRKSGVSPRDVVVAPKTYNVSFRGWVFADELIPRFSIEEIGVRVNTVVCVVTVGGDRRL